MTSESCWHCDQRQDKARAGHLKVLRMLGPLKGRAMESPMCAEGRHAHVCSGQARQSLLRPLSRTT